MKNRELVQSVLTDKGQQILTIANKTQLTVEQVKAACSLLRADGIALYDSDTSGYRLNTIGINAVHLSKLWGVQKQERTKVLYY